MAQTTSVLWSVDQGLGEEEKAQARQNIGAGTGTGNSTIVHDSNTLPPVDTNVNQMTIFNDGRTKFDNLYSGVIPSEPGQSEGGRVLVANYVSSPAKGTAQWKDVHNIGLREVPAGGSNGKVLTWNNGTYDWADSHQLPAITHYDASWGNKWHSMRQLTDDISSGTVLNTTTLSTPIQLSANKRYMIIPVGVAGNVEQTKTISHSTSNTYSLDLWLSDSSKSIYNGKTAVQIAEAEICNHKNTQLGEYPPVGGTYRASFNSYSVIIAPEVDLTLDTLTIMNSGNISWGFNRSNPALLVFEHRITGINVMEIQ